MKGWVFVVVWATSCCASADVYKCDDGKGGAVYSSTPCGENSRQLDIKEGAANPSEGLRPGEQELLDAIKQREKEAKENPPPAPVQEDKPENPQASRCSGLEIISFTTFERQGVEAPPEPRRGIIVPRNLNLAYWERCATVTFKGPGYHNRLVDSAAEDIAARLYAVLTDGSGIIAHSGSIKATSIRLSGRDTYTGEFCFGYTDNPIVELKCR